MQQQMDSGLIAERDAELRIKLVQELQEARERTLELIADLSDEQMMGPRLAIVNPLRWEVGHVAWFQEYWVLRHARGHSPILGNGDALYDSAKVAHDTRWDLPLPSKTETLAYMQQVLDRVAELGESQSSASHGGESHYDEAYFMSLALLHECMHAEAITYTRQTLEYSEPRIAIAKPRQRDEVKEEAAESAAQHQNVSGDVKIPGGVFMLGSAPAYPFVFDNEQWAHQVEVAPFSISRTAVSNREFAAFVEDDGYRRRELWSDAGWRWREGEGAEHPLYWKKNSAGEWLRRNFDKWVPLEANHPVLHVNWFEAEAYCRWARRRLPTEAEWEMAASCEPTPDSSAITERKRRFPWGDEPPTPERANLDWRNIGCVDVSALPAGDSAFGCRQMIGNTWEWTATDFNPYPGFSPGPYKEYSAPWFGDHKVLRGGCWVTRSLLITNTYRNFYKPDRRDVWAGFRTCAI
ncbi:MAG TPA: selenoneine synthase SenA [Blastocatellia bacterium]|nr:selenoneine synthase SenA [Blastocatellia bacterium]